ncbi:restriction endonuclease [Streptomyces sp. NBC_01538]|uniref:restriction endonuclease n=1 Tax=Streptomyces sp. NBC_01538 TaxID=2903897 RepID=UPI003862D528
MPQRGTVDRVRHIRMVVWRTVYRGSGWCLVALTVCVLGLLAGRWTGWWPSPYPAAVDLAGVPILLTYAVWMQQRVDRDRWNAAQKGNPRLEMSLEDLDGLGHEEFEFAVRDLLRRDGLAAERVGGANDDVCDVRAVDLDHRVWAVQCKHRRDGIRGDAVDVRVVRELKGTASDVHKATFAVIVTNGKFTNKAVPQARILGVHLAGRDLLALWASGRPLWELLEHVPPPLRHPADGRRVAA